jgi:formate hydrogenlyase subunit 3/multisubunit Na+/H+ antiporter MnhD subunit
LKRLRLVGTVALAIGVVFCASVVVTRSLGYAPDDSVASLFAAMWPTGLALVILGGLLWVGVWVLHGFVPPAHEDATVADPAPRRAHLEE